MEAREQFAAGREAYDAGRFDDAVHAFRRAYVLSSRFALLYNVGQAELRTGDDARALEAFEGFLRQAPTDDPHRAEVEERVRQLRAMGVTAAATDESEDAASSDEAADESDETDASAEPDLASTATPSESVDPAPWIVVGAGGVVAIVGAVLMGVGFSDAGRLWGSADGSHWIDVSGAAGDANTLWGVGIALAAVGVVTAGVGIGWALSATHGASEPSARLQLGPSGIRLEGAF